MPKMNRLLAACLAPVMVLLASAPGTRAGPWTNANTVVVRNDAELRALTAERIPPGATLLLAPGRYAGGLSIGEARGTEGKPITIGAQDPKRPPVIAGGKVGMHLQDPAYLTVRDLVFENQEANGLNVDDRSSMTFTARGVTLRNVVVRDMKGTGNNDGFKLSGVADFLIDGCTVTNWGAGGSGIDMVGCRDGAIVGSKFTQAAAGPSNAIQAKGGSTKVLIDRCAIDTAGQRGINLGGSTGLPYFRPQPPGSFEAKEITVRACSIKGAMAPVSFVGVDGALVEDSVIYRPTRWVVRVLQEQRAPGFVPSRGGVLRNNAFVFRSDEARQIFSVGDGTAPETFTFEGNWWFCQDNPGRSKPQLPTPEKGGVYGKDPQLADPERGDFRWRRNLTSGGKS